MDLFKSGDADLHKERDNPTAIRDKADVHLQETQARLERACLEYDQTVSRLMNIKKELKDKEAERQRLDIMNEGIRVQIDAGRRTLQNSHKDLETARRTAADLEHASADLRSKMEMRKRLDEDIAGAQSRLNSINSDIREQEAKKTKEESHDKAERDVRLAAADAERDRLAAELAVRDQTIRGLEQQLAASETARRQAVRPLSDRGVVEAATALVASLRTRLNSIQKELDHTRQQLEEARRQLDSRH